MALASKVRVYVCVCVCVYFYGLLLTQPLGCHACNGRVSAFLAESYTIKNGMAEWTCLPLMIKENTRSKTTPRATSISLSVSVSSSLSLSNGYTLCPILRDCLPVWNRKKCEERERELLLRCRMTANTNWLPEKVAKYGEEPKGSYQTRSLDSLVWCNLCHKSNSKNEWSLLKNVYFVQVPSNDMDWLTYFEWNLFLEQRFQILFGGCAERSIPTAEIQWILVEKQSTDYDRRQQQFANFGRSQRHSTASSAERIHCKCMQIKSLPLLCGYVIGQGSE